MRNLRKFVNLGDFALFHQICWNSGNFSSKLVRFAEGLRKMNEISKMNVKMRKCLTKFSWIFFSFFLTQRAGARARPSSSVLDKKDEKTRQNVTCLPKARAERTGLTVSVLHACLKILSFVLVSCSRVHYGWQRRSSKRKPKEWRQKQRASEEKFGRRWHREWRYSPGPKRGLLPTGRRLAPAAGAPPTGPHRGAARSPWGPRKAATNRTSKEKNESVLQIFFA